MSTPSSPSLGRLLISHITLRGPEIEQLYSQIADCSNINYDDLCAQIVPLHAEGSEFGLDQAALREALNFLLVARLVGQQGATRRRATFYVTPRLERTSFPLLLLHHLLTHPDERQQAISTIYAQLVADDTFALTPQAIRSQMERGPLRELFAWTGEKIALWTHLLSYVGLVRRLDRGDDVLLVPRPALVLAALSGAGARADATCSLADCLQVIDTQIFACFTRRGRVHSGLAQTLIALHRLGRVRLSHSADAARSLLLIDWRVSDVRLATTSEVNI